RELHAVVLEADLEPGLVVAADEAIALRDADDLLDRLELLERRRGHGVRRPEEVDLGQRAAHALDAVDLGGDAGEAARELDDARHLRVGDVGLEYDDHRAFVAQNPPGVPISPRARGRGRTASGRP